MWHWQTNKRYLLINSKIQIDLSLICYIIQIPIIYQMRLRHPPFRSRQNLQFRLDYVA